MRPIRFSTKRTGWPQTADYCCFHRRASFKIACKFQEKYSSTFSLQASAIELHQRYLFASTIFCIFRCRIDRWLSFDRQSFESNHSRWRKNKNGSTDCAIQWDREFCQFDRVRLCVCDDLNDPQMLSQTEFAPNWFEWMNSTSGHNRFGCNPNRDGKWKNNRPKIGKAENKRKHTNKIKTIENAHAHTWTRFFLVQRSAVHWIDNSN